MLRARLAQTAPEVEVLPTLAQMSAEVPDHHMAGEQLPHAAQRLRELRVSDVLYRWLAQVRSGLVVACRLTGACDAARDTSREAYAWAYEIGLARQGGSRMRPIRS